MFYDSEDNIVVLPKEKLAVIQDLKVILLQNRDNCYLSVSADEDMIRQFVNDTNFKYDGSIHKWRLGMT